MLQNGKASAFAHGIFTGMAACFRDFYQRGATYPVAPCFDAPFPASPQCSPVSLLPVSLSYLWISWRSGCSFFQTLSCPEHFVKERRWNGNHIWKPNWTLPLKAYKVQDVTWKEVLMIIYTPLGLFFFKGKQNPQLFYLGRGLQEKGANRRRKYRKAGKGVLFL